MNRIVPSVWSNGTFSVTFNNMNNYSNRSRCRSSSNWYIQISITEITTCSDTSNQILTLQSDQNHDILLLYSGQSQDFKTQVTYQVYISKIHHVRSTQSTSIPQPLSQLQSSGVYLTSPKSRPF